MYKKFSNKNRPTRKNYMDETTYTDHSKAPEVEGPVNDLIGVKARSSLPKSTYSIKADPYESSLPSANPYDLIAPFNRTVGGSYAGLDNLSGGNIQQYANSYDSGTLNAFDFVRLALAINYRYIPRDLAAASFPTYDEATKKWTLPPTLYVGSGLVNMQRQSIAEATSILQATTFTQMAINDYAVESTIPMGDAEYSIVKETNADTGAVTEHMMNTDLADVIYSASSFYQIFWQEVISVINSFNSFRLKQGTMIRSSWNRETPTLNGLFGLFNKKAFLSLLDSICLSVQGEYIDTEWVQQFNLLTSMPSRRTNSIHDPVLEISCRHQHPTKFKLQIVDDSKGNLVNTVFDIDDLLTSIVGSTEKVSFFDACQELKEKFSAEYVMHWARNTDSRSALKQNAYYNRVTDLLDVVQTCCTLMKIKFNDVREVFDVISRTGLNTWVKNYRPTITQSTDAALFDNNIVNAIYKTVFSGPVSIELDAATKRWRTYTLWDLYDGVPEYDAKSGGCFITFSGKQLSKLDSAENQDYTRQWLPVAFYIDSATTTIQGIAPALRAVNRNGLEIIGTYREFEIGEINALARLAPLKSQSSFKMRVPTFQYEGQDEDLTPSVQSWIAMTFTNLFGYCYISTNFYIDPDILFIYEVEIADITNESIRYARLTSPFRGAAPEGTGQLLLSEF